MSSTVNKGPGLGGAASPVPSKPYGFCGRKATLKRGAAVSSTVSKGLV